MVFLYTAWHSRVLLRPKKVQLLHNKKCRKLNLYGEMGTYVFEIWAELFLKNKNTPDDLSFLPQCYATTVLG